MCDFATLMTAGTAVLSSALGVGQQLQRAAGQRADLGWLAQQQYREAETDETRARLAEQEGEAAAGKARQKTAVELGRMQARLAAQGSDLLGSPLDVLGALAAAGEEDALSFDYRAARNAWENRVQGARRRAQARYYETAVANVDPSLGIARSLLS